MPDEKRPRSAGIRLENCSDGIVIGNRIHGFDDGISAVNAHRLHTSRNVITGTDEDRPRPEEDEKGTQRFFSGWRLSKSEILTGLIVTVIGGAILWVLGFS